MLTNRLRLYIRTVSTRGGFTLVELLVVIGIIAILAGVALGPITNGIKKAKESAGVQSSHALGLAMYSAANDNNQLYPDASGGDASNIAKTLLGGGYVTDPAIFFISGDSNGAAKYSLTTPAAANIAQSNVSWDFVSNGGNGVSSTTFQFMPLMWSTLAAGTEPTFTTSGTGAVTAVPNASCPFGTDGVACFYVNNSATFLNSTFVTSAYQINMITSSNNTGEPATAETVLKGK
jgi:prepilin-type N-terminal cleavage/methylation domain-containing protein